MTTTTPRIYVACLASYNAGKLHGEWIDCDQDAATIREEIATMLRESPCPNVEVDCPHCDGSGELQPDEECPECNGTGKVPSAEEWAIHDYEGFGEWKLGEHTDIDEIVAYAEAIADLDESDAEAFQAWVDNSHYEKAIDADTVEEFREEYHGVYDSLADYAQSWCEDTGSIPKDLPAYIHIDWEATGRDFELGGDIWTHRGEHGLHVFYNS